MTVELAHPSTEPQAQRSPVEPAHPRWWFLTTTPGRILSFGVLLAALGILSAFAISTTVTDRQQRLTEVLEHTEPLAFAAGQLYTTLSVADAAAATAFIAGAEPRPVRQRYEQAITDAAVAVTRASSGLTDPRWSNCSAASMPGWRPIPGSSRSPARTTGWATRSGRRTCPRPRR